jgi:hypothetical protein
LEIIPNNGYLSIKSLALKALEDYWGVYPGVLLKKLIEQVTVRVQSGGPMWPFRNTLLRIFQILFYCGSA